MKDQPPVLSIRPYQVVNIIGRLGAGRDPSDLGDPALTALVAAMIKDPRTPFVFRLYGGDRYNGADAEAPEGVLFHILRDWEIMERMFAYASPFRTHEVFTGVFLLLQAAWKITTLKGINYFDPPASPAWKGATDISEEEYQRGRAKVPEFCKSILPSFMRFAGKDQQMAVKQSSAAAIYSSAAIRIYPSHFLYIIGHYGGSLDFPAAQPLAHDNLHEPGRALRLNPEVPIILVPEHCMVCPPCMSYDPQGSGLCGVHPQHLKPVQKTNIVALKLLQTLGLEYYQPLPAVQLVKLAFERLPLDHISFTYQGAPPSPWSFARARAAGAGFLDAYDDAQGMVRRVTALLKRRDVRAALPAAECRHAEEILRSARAALTAGDRKKAYQALIDEPFWNAWKMCMERAAAWYCRLPQTMRRAAPAMGADNLPELSATPARGRIACDGRLNENDWQRAPFSAGFKTMVERPALAETAVRVMYDRENLYIGIIGAEKTPRDLKASARTGMELKQTDYNRYVWHTIDDAFLVVLQPNEGEPAYFNFIVNPRGIKLGDMRRPTTRTTLYDTDWQAAAYVDKKSWSAEMIIPFRVLGSKGHGQKPWRINIHRFFRNELLDPHSWSYAVRRIDDLGRLGRLVFNK